MYIYRRSDDDGACDLLEKGEFANPDLLGDFGWAGPMHPTSASNCM